VSLTYGSGQAVSLKPDGNNGNADKAREDRVDGKTGEEDGLPISNGGIFKSASLL
jgi:hypothetical protein